MAKFVEVEVWVLVDEDGDYAVGKDAAAAGEEYDSEYGLSGERGTRRVRITVKVPAPEPIELKGEVTADAEPGDLQVA